MRCQFCGWDNPQGKESCEKCDKPLVAERASAEVHPEVLTPDYHNRPTDRKAEAAFNPKATVRESALGTKESAPKQGLCPDCGYQLEDGKCSACGYCATSEVEAPSPIIPEDVRKTIRPIRKSEKSSSFRLTPISEETGEPEGEALTFEGSEVILNRDNTDAANPTITSQEQAYVAFTNGKWVIVDKSEYKTTFVQAARATELQSGDLILLGNQLYRFEE